MPDIHRLLGGSLEFRRVLEKNIPLEALSDVVRVELLARFGGVWADSTTYCLRPLDDWVDGAACSGFFAFDKPGPDRMLSTWFLAATNNSNITGQWREEIYSYWSERTQRDSYFWVHDTFKVAYNTRRDFRSEWDRTPKLPADGPHCCAPYDSLYLPPTPTIRFIVETAQTPILKLTHKIDHNDISKNSLYNYFCESERCIKEIPIPPSRTAKSATASAHGAGTDPRRTAIAWFGSYQGHGTIGDLLSVRTIAARLYASGHDFTTISNVDDVGTVGPVSRLDEIDPSGIDTLVFVCGPIIAGHPIVDDVIKRFAHARRIGLAVSLFPRDHPLHANPFGTVFAREGMDTTWEDIAILAPTDAHLPRADAPSTGRPLRVGRVLRGPQSEYGIDLSLHEYTAELAENTISELRKNQPVEVIDIEHVLRHTPYEPGDFDRIYKTLDLVLTSRFHGGIMAARNHVPFIAVDQISGGAKITALLGERGWPHVYSASEHNTTDIVQAAFAILEKYDEKRSDIRLYASKLAGMARRTLDAVEHSIIGT